MSNKKTEIEAKNQQNAVEILRTKLDVDEVSNIRVDRIEQVNVKKEPEKKRKRSVFGLAAVGILVLAGSARLLSKFL